MKLWKNWLAALALAVIGVLATAVEGDATFLVVTLVFSAACLGLPEKSVLKMGQKP